MKIMLNMRGTLIWLLLLVIVCISCSHSLKAYQPPGNNLSNEIDNNALEVVEINQISSQAVSPVQETDKTAKDNETISIPNAPDDTRTVTAGQDSKSYLQVNKCEKTEEYIEKALSKHRNYYISALNRFEKIRLKMEDILEEHGLPRDLVYLAFVESAGDPHALSPSGAGGYWQFIPGTAKVYGLKIDTWVDERKHLEKSTRAAARYLSDLHDMFGDWLLACAAYNAGETAILRIIKKYPDINGFWDISPDMIYKYETIAFVPKILAAIQIGRNRNEYLIPEPIDCNPPEFETLMVDGSVTFQELSKITGKSIAAFTALNPELKKKCTPPNQKEYVLKVPVGTSDILVPALASREMKTAKTVSGDMYLKYSENKKIASKDFRKLKPSSIASPNRKKNKLMADRRSVEGNSNILTHKVRKGDTVWSISKRYEVSPEDVKMWNQLGTESRITPGDKLTIYLK